MASTGLYVAVAGAVAVIFLSWGLPIFLAEYFPWQSLYKQRHGKPTVVTKSYKGRTALITGANGAFGSRVAKNFAHREVGTLVLADVRDCGGVKAEIEAELKEQGKPVPKILVWQIDLMTFAGCQELGKKAKTLESLDHALMTAGILTWDRRESPEGWESSIQVNFLSSALNGLLLLPLMKSAPSNPNPPVLTFVTTFGIYPSSFTLGMPKTGSYLKKLSNNKEGLEQSHQYGRSKALLLYFTRELAARVSAATASGKLGKVTVNSADPGSAWTGLTNPTRSNIISKLIMDFGARAPEICAIALTNGVSVSADGHGKIQQDFDTTTYPPFMLRKSGQVAQQRVWDEAKAEFESKAPEAKAVYELLE
ncbi:unnamed protein product [Clonostachys rosea f. rosea IK726]|uniref:Ketoreductase (KR) domain-containing protein n=2 Tax=Bionectria ochroleuca TaxID=29856 RepID=A0A0B7JME1_BIOOC|nr:unnamed protein product [Clonostachys rosea f. rosea IK726]